ncbi:MAG: hypothetical protein Q7S76_03775 [bacterium]|nr:hypothetical protein [bacterium]
MKNVERLAKYITKHGSNSFLVHTVPETSNWLICQKIENDKWALTLGNPMGNVTYNLGTVTDAQHLEIWEYITTVTIERKVSQLAVANEYKGLIHHFLLSNYEKEYKNFIKKENKKETSPKEYKKFIADWKKENPSKAKQQRTKLRQRSKGPKKPLK